MKTGFFGLALLMASADMAGAEMLDVLDVKVKNNPADGAYAVVVRLSEPSGEILQRLTAENVGRNIAIEVNGKAVWVPTIAAPTTNQYFLIGNLSQEFAERLASTIRDARTIGAEVQMPSGG
jgi:preprotein translocase subunit SecD